MIRDTVCLRMRSKCSAGCSNERGHGIISAHAVLCEKVCLLRFPVIPVRSQDAENVCKAADGRHRCHGKTIRGDPGRDDLYRGRNPVGAGLWADRGDHGTCQTCVSCRGWRGDLHGGESRDGDAGETYGLPESWDQPAELRSPVGE